jgi:hypothetical protein
MPIQNMPASLQAVIQQGFLETEFKDGLNSALGYRSIADKEPVKINVGETVTKTRRGLKAPVTTALTPSGNTNLDNGLTPSAFTVEQYTLGVGMYADTIDLNVVTSQVGIANQFMVNAKTNGTQARQSLDRLARNALFNGYMGANTRVRATLGAPALTIQVDDVRGFGFVLVNGVYVAVSGTNTAQVLVGSNTYTLTGVAVDGSNVSSAIGSGGLSGTLTFQANVSVADGTALNTVAHLNAPALIRPNGKYFGGSAASATTSTASLTAGDVLTLGAIEDAVAMVRNNTGIVDQDFNLYLDNVSMRQIFADGDFKLMYQGQYGSKEARSGKMFNLMGVNFIPTTEAFVQNAGSGVAVKVRRPILCAQGALVEGDFDGMTEKAHETAGMNAEVQMIDGVAQITRGPLDRLQQIVAQSWYWIGGFVAPTDATATSAIIPTAGNQYWKRAVVIEHAG